MYGEIGEYYLLVNCAVNCTFRLKKLIKCSSATLACVCYP